MPSRLSQYFSILAAPLAVLALAFSLPSCLAAGREAPSRTAGHKLPQRPLVVGYFGQWSLYDHFVVKNLITSGAAAELDQINYAQGFVTGGHCSVADPNADLNVTFSTADSVSGRADEPTTPFHGNFHQIAELKRLHPRLKVLISLEGHATDFAADAQPAAREIFVRSCVDIFLRGHLVGSPNVNPVTPDEPGLFDGIDVDWEYPGEENAANFLALLTEFRRQMDSLRPGLRLTIAVGPSPRMYPGVDMAVISQIVDQVGIMNYDYIGPWSHTTGLIAPLYAEEARGGSVERSILSYKEAGIPAARILLGLPFYGYGWHSVDAASDGLYQPGQGIRGDRPYSYFQSLLRSSPAPSPSPAVPLAAAPPTLKPAAIGAGTPATQLAISGPSLVAPSSRFILYRDPHSQAPWLYNGDIFWTFEDSTSISRKTQFALDQQLGGVMIWELSEDAPNAALLKAARHRLNHPDAKP